MKWKIFHAINQCNTGIQTKDKAIHKIRWFSTLNFWIYRENFTIKIRGGEFNCNSRSVGICSKPKFQGNFALWIERECFENSLNFTSQIDSSSILFKSPCRLSFYSKRQLFHSIKKRTRLRVSLCGKPKKNPICCYNWWNWFSVQIGPRIQFQKLKVFFFGSFRFSFLCYIRKLAAFKIFHFNKASWQVSSC